MARKIWLVNLVILAGLAAILYQTYHVWNRGMGGEAVQVAGRDTAKTVKPSFSEIATPKPRENYKGVTDNNLFSQDRAPEETAPVITAPAKQLPQERPQDRYVLYGVIRLDEKKYYALILDKKSPEKRTKAYAVGDSLTRGLTVEAINDKKVLLSSATGEDELRLRASKGPEDMSYKPPPIPAEQVRPQAVQRRPPRPIQRTQPRVAEPSQRRTAGQIRQRVEPGRRTQDDYDYEDEEYYEDEDYYEDEYDYDEEDEW